jgi:hypothetical protein
VDHVNTGHGLEQLAGQMRAGPGTKRSHGDFAGLCFSVVDKRWHCLGRNHRVHDHDEGYFHKQCDGREIAQKIERKRFIKRRM